MPNCLFVKWNIKTICTAEKSTVCCWLNQSIVYPFEPSLKLSLDAVDVKGFFLSLDAEERGVKSSWIIIYALMIYRQVTCVWILTR